MQLKLLLSLIGLLGSIVVILSRKYPLKSIFWFGIFFLWVRQLSFPIIETLNLSFLIFTILSLINPSILFNKNNFKEWRIWYLVLLIGILNALIFGVQKEFFAGTNILSKSFDWSVKFFVVIFISSCITHYVKTKKELNRLLNLFLWSCFIFSFTAIIAYFGFYDGVIIYGSGSLTDGFVQDLTRDNIYSEIYGISSSNLVFGISSLGIVFIPYLNWKAWKKYLFFTLIGFAVIISLKRLAIISLVLSLFYFLIIEKKKGNNIWILAIPLIFLSIGSSYYDLIFRRFFGAINSIDLKVSLDTSSNIRIDRLNLAWENFLKNPIFGQGAGYVIYIHNGFLEILANLGLLGFVIFKPLVKPIKYLKNNFYNPWAVSLIILMITLVALEAAINRFEIMYFIGLLYGGFLVSLKINKNDSHE